MPDFKDLITYYIAIASIIVTGIFSFLVWRSSQENAKVAKSSYELTLEIRKQQEQKERQLHASFQIEHLKTALKNVSNVYYFLAKLEKRQVSSDRFKEVPENCGVIESDMARFIDMNINNDIHESWARYETFVDTFWKGPSGAGDLGTYDHAHNQELEKVVNQQLISVFYNLKTVIENDIKKTQYNQIGI